MNKTMKSSTGTILLATGLSISACGGGSSSNNANNQVNTGVKILDGLPSSEPCIDFGNVISDLLNTPSCEIDLSNNTKVETDSGVVLIQLTSDQEKIMLTNQDLYAVISLDGFPVLIDKRHLPVNISTILDVLQYVLSSLNISNKNIQPTSRVYNKVLDGYYILADMNNNGSIDLEDIDITHSRLSQLIDALLLLQKSGKKILEPTIKKSIDSVARFSMSDIAVSSFSKVIDNEITYSLIVNVGRNIPEDNDKYKVDLVEHIEINVGEIVYTFNSENIKYDYDDNNGILEVELTEDFNGFLGTRELSINYKDDFLSDLPVSTKKVETEIIQPVEADVSFSNGLILSDGSEVLGLSVDDGISSGTINFSIGEEIDLDTIEIRYLLHGVTTVNKDDIIIDGNNVRIPFSTSLEEGLGVSQVLVSAKTIRGVSIDFPSSQVVVNYGDEKATELNTAPSISLNPIYLGENDEVVLNLPEYDLDGDTIIYRFSGLDSTRGYIKKEGNTYTFVVNKNDTNTGSIEFNGVASDGVLTTDFNVTIFK